MSKLDSSDIPTVFPNKHISLSKTIQEPVYFHQFRHQQ